MEPWISRRIYFAIFMVLYVFYNPTDSEAIAITDENIDEILEKHELVIINFYAEWCRFSRSLAPIFDESALKIRTSGGHPEGKVVLGKVNCVDQTAIAKRFEINKYPTLKVIHNNDLKIKEYRGQRSVDALFDFVNQQLRDSIREFKSLKDLQNLDSKKRIIVGYFDRRDQPEYDVFRKVATHLKDDCQFHVGFGDTVQAMHPPGTPIIVFRPDVALSHENDETYKGTLNSFDDLKRWAYEKCIPLVREITFENAEELTEEGLPLLILFHHPNDTNSIKDYKAAIERELLKDKKTLNFLTADGRLFAHPLHHLGKSEKDLPLIAIDSFRHMYLFSSFKDIYIEQKLKQFVIDLNSGKLHREFHFGPDPSSDVQAEGDFGTVKQTTPPESTFKKLSPSNNRYSLLKKEEL